MKIKLSAELRNQIRDAAFFRAMGQMYESGDSMELNAQQSWLFKKIHGERGGKSYAFTHRQSTHYWFLTIILPVTSKYSLA